MKRRFSTILLCASLAANLCALAYFSLRNGEAERPAVRVAQPMAAVPQAPKTAIIRRVATPTNSGLPRIWGRVESTDLRKLAENLHAIGCPEVRIRDIVMTDAFRELGRQLSEQGKVTEKPFWYSDAGWYPPVTTNNLAQAVDEIGKLSNELFGLNPCWWLFDVRNWWNNNTGWYNRLDEDGLYTDRFLPPANSSELNSLSSAKYVELVEIRRRYEELTRPIDQLTDKPDMPWEEKQKIWAQTKIMRAQQKDEELALLTESERRNRELREDTTLVTLLTGQKVTRELFEQMHDLMAKHGGSKEPFLVDGSPEQAQAIALMGETGYTQFRRNADSRFGNALPFSPYEEHRPISFYNELDDLRPWYKAALAKGTTYEAALATVKDEIRQMHGEDEKARRAAEKFIERLIPKPSPHTLEATETLENLARRHGLTAAQALSANGLAPDTVLKPGATLLLPCH